MRHSELLGLQWTDLDWESRKLRIQRQYYRGNFCELKSAAGRRSLTLGAVTIQKLREHRQRTQGS
jgi:integrase